MPIVLQVLCYATLPLLALASVVEIITDERRRAVWIAEREKFRGKGVK